MKFLPNLIAEAEPDQGPPPFGVAAAPGGVSCPESGFLD
jgi:hypothetical protein